MAGKAGHRQRLMNRIRVLLVSTPVADLNTGDSPLQADGGTIEIDIRIVQVSQALLRTFFGGQSTRFINFFGFFGPFGEDGHTVGQHFAIASSHKNVMAYLPGSVGNFSDLKLCDERRVPRQNAQVAIASGQLDLIDSFFQDETGWGHDFQVKFVHEADQRSAVRCRRAQRPAANDGPLTLRFHPVGLLEGLVNIPDHVKGLLRKTVMLAFYDFLKAAHSFV
jgi:hypothetical protein